MASICFNVVSASGLLVAQRISIKQLLNHLQGTSVSQAIQDLSVVHKHPHYCFQLLMLEGNQRSGCLKAEKEKFLTTKLYY